MFSIRYLFLILIWLATLPASGQNITGQVKVNPAKGETSELAGANIYFVGSTSGTISDTDGHFSLPTPTSYPVQLVVSFIGHQSDTLTLDGPPAQPLSILLNEGKDLNQFEVKRQVHGHSISTMDPLHVESINSRELEKAACCNISESFETTASIDVANTDAVSGTRKVRMLGLDGVYSQLMLENIPWLRGLGASGSLDRIPGTWVESIQVTKGSGSVVNGYESITGQINLELLKPDKVADRLFVNLYGNNMGRGEVNVHANLRSSERWSSLLFLHASGLQTKNERNDDGFLDMPLRESYHAFNRWKYKGDSYRAQFGGRVLYDQVTGGQTSFDPDQAPGGLNSYGLGHTVTQAEIFGKSGILLKDDRHSSIGMMGTLSFEEHESFWGLTDYDGTEIRGYFNFIFQTELAGEKHLLKTGGSMLFNEFEARFNQIRVDRIERVPGVFAEYTFNDHKFWSLVGGLRLDYHNIYGTQFTPRVHAKYNIGPETALRLSAGRGFRVPNVFADNTGIFASSRQVILDGGIDAEIAWNMGGSFVHQFHVGNRESWFSTDYFFTTFENQMVVDRETPGFTQIYSLDGRSFSHSWQIESGIEILPELEFRAAYKRYLIRTQFGSNEKEVPLIPRDRALANISYTTEGRKWSFDLTAQWFGASRIPATMTAAEAESETYQRWLGQITRRFLHWEFYSGVENIFNYRQPEPILGVDDPFGSNFEAAMVWGPVAGRIVYGGLRFKI